MPDTQTPTEIADNERAMLIREARDRAARRIGTSTSIGAADAAQGDLKFAVNRIEALSEAQLLEKANLRRLK